MELNNSQRILVTSVVSKLAYFLYDFFLYHFTGLLQNVQENCQIKQEAYRSRNKCSKKLLPNKFTYDKISLWIK